MLYTFFCTYFQSSAPPRRTSYDPLTILPPEVMALSLSMLCTAKELSRFGVTCRASDAIFDAHDVALWQPLCVARWRAAACDPRALRDFDGVARWRERYTLAEQDGANSAVPKRQH